MGRLDLPDPVRDEDLWPRERLAAHPIPDKLFRNMGTITEMRDRPISKRQKEVAAGLAQGKTRKEVADFLGIAEETVKHHMAALREKTGARNSLQAIVTLARDGVI